MKRCFKCNSRIEIDKPSFRGSCPSCGSDIHVCLNCKFYDESYSKKCREPMAEPQREKDRANFCEYFQFKEYEEEYSGRRKAEEMWKKIFRK